MIVAFLGGVIATISAEAIAMVVYAIVVNWKKGEK